MMAGQSPRTSNWFPLPSRIGRRLLAFNLLVLFLPIAAILYLDVYEARLLDSQERGMGQQARILAASLSRLGPLDARTAATLLTDLGERGDARLRIYDGDGKLLVDSNRIASRRTRAGSRLCAGRWDSRASVVSPWRVDRGRAENVG